METDGIEDTGALVVVKVGVNVVNTDGVDAESLHEGSITHASIGVGQRVLVLRGLVAGAATGLVANTNDLELVARVGVIKVVALDFEGLDGADGRGGERHQSSLDLGEAHSVRLVVERRDGATRLEEARARMRDKVLGCRSSVWHVYPTGPAEMEPDRLTSMMNRLSIYSKSGGKGKYLVIARLYYSAEARKGAGQNGEEWRKSPGKSD